MFGTEDALFLTSVGCSRQEMFDFVDDSQHYGEPDLQTALEVTDIRFRYFKEVMDGKPTGKEISMDNLPAKTDSVDGIEWLPRLIAKARAKLRGEMNADLMYGCGGDRPFLAKMNMTLPQFLQLTWDSGSDDRRIIETVKKHAGATV